MREMKPQFFAGVAVAVLALVGAWTYAFWGGEVTDSGNSNNSIAQAVVQEFTERMRVGTIERVGQPIEGYEPFMFMRAFPGLTANDFQNVDALIGIYRYQDGNIVYDLNGEQELHSAARAISDEGMLQLLINVSGRFGVDLATSGALDQLFAKIEVAPGVDPAAGGAAGGTVPAEEPGQNLTTLTGKIVCLPHKPGGDFYTLECAFGLLADNGKHYGLQNLWEVAPGLTDTEVRVQVKGVLHTPAANEKYDIVGTLEVREARAI